MYKVNCKPTVSVIMPVYNAGEFIVEAIESILNQTYKNFEFIIVDDGSTDNSWQIIQKFQKRHPRLIKTYRLNKQTNYAGNGATNHGLKFAKGEFIVRMDADDIAHPQRLEKQVTFMIKNPDVILLGTQANLIDRLGKKIGKKIVPITHKKIYEEYGIVHPIIHPTCMFRRSLLPDPNKIYANKYGVNSDYYSFFYLLNYGKFANLPEFLLNYRIHANNFSLKYPKKKFINSLKIRYAAITRFGYKITLKAFCLTLIQALIVGLIPERLIVPLYLRIRAVSGL